jgi:hypothetical protein
MYELLKTRIPKDMNQLLNDEIILKKLFLEKDLESMGLEDGSIPM